MQRRLVAALTALAAFAVPAASASADPDNNNSPKLRAAVTVDGIREHMAAWQAIANANSGNRLAGTSGHDASAQYVFDRLQAAGYSPRFQNFNYTFTGNRTAPILARVNGPSYVAGFQFTTPTSLAPADSGDVTAPLFAVDLGLPTPAGSTSGCDVADFAGFPAGGIALIRRGQCDFVLKIQNAINAGARAVVLFNEGNTAAADRRGLFNPATTGDLPVLAATFAVGQELSNGVNQGLTGTQVRVKVDIISQSLPTRNVIAETSGREDNVIVVGAHLDGVEDGPGINDNGSGSGTILEIAEQMHKVKPRNQVRFIWFSAEESGLLGSAFYVSQLSADEKADIAGMLNFDMLASPNFVRFVYDGDLSSFPGPPGGAPAGSAVIEEIFLDYFEAQGLPTAPTAFDGRSDYRDFIRAGIPAGGLFTGAEVAKTAAQAAIYGGAAGEQYDPCYHAFCDSLATLDGVPPALALINPASAESMRGNGFVGLDQMSDAAAHAVITLAQSTNVLNGERGKGNFNTDAQIEREAAR
jgi:Zn-dependent M28 family amino/carboxypeptidase